MISLKEVPKDDGSKFAKVAHIVLSSITSPREK